MSNKPKKILKKVISILVILILLTTFFVGNYFINYALVPNKGGEDREIVTEESSEGKSKQNTEIKKTINENSKKIRKLAREFPSKVKDQTEEITIKSNDGLSLYGHKYLQKTKSNKWMVIVHGYQANEKESNLIAQHFYSQGFNILTYNQRAMAPSQGKFITMGIKESDDLIMWLEAIKKDYPQAEFVLHGTSMGSATVLIASGKDNFPKDVKAIIADCGYSSVWDIFASELKQRFNMPAFPVLHMASLVGIPKVGINLMSDDGNVIKQVEKSSTPTLFIHGTADDFVPFAMVEKLYGALNIDEKELFSVEGAGHAESKFVNPEKYYGKILEFVNGKIEK